MRDHSKKQTLPSKVLQLAIGGAVAFGVLAAATPALADGSLERRRGTIRPPDVHTPSAPSLDPREVMVPIDPPRPATPSRDRDRDQQTPASTTPDSGPQLSWVQRLLIRLCGFGS